MKQQMASTAHTQMEMFKMLRRYTSLYNISPSPQQHTSVSNATTNPPPPLVLASAPAVIAAPTTAAPASATPCPVPPDNVEVAMETAAECGISAGVKRNNPSSATSADENPTKQYKMIVNNFDHQRQHSGGTIVLSQSLLMRITIVISNLEESGPSERLNGMPDSGTMQSFADV
jgi:hypothetical protein